MSKDLCWCPRYLGGTDCKTQVGIAEMYVVSPAQVEAFTYTSVADDCCPEGEIATIVLDTDTPALPVQLFQQIDFVKQTDNSGAVFTRNTVYDTGNENQNRTLTFQVNIGDSASDCVAHSMIGRELMFVIKLKNGKWKAINQEGGMVVTALDDNSNQSYTELALTGVPNVIDKYIDTTWANDNMKPFALGGLVADIPTV